MESAVSFAVGETRLPYKVVPSQALSKTMFDTPLMLCGFVLSYRSPEVTHM